MGVIDLVSTDSDGAAILSMGVVGSVSPRGLQERLEGYMAFALDGEMVRRPAARPHTAPAAHISMSHVERQNLTMRMSMRRFTRLTNAFSKKVDNLNAAVALHFMHYNFARVRQSLG